MDGIVTGVEIEAGQTMVGAVAFNMGDDVDAAGDFEFCARGKDNTLENDVFPCIPTPAPTPRD